MGGRAALLLAALSLSLAATRSMELLPSDASTTRCKEADREALLEFKRGLEDASNRLPSWAGEDCCRWAGVTCSNRTGRVTRLDLHGFHIPSFMGSFPSLGNLCKLRRLDLARVTINRTLASLDRVFSRCIRNSLEELDLSTAYLSGFLPDWIGDLQNLKSLDLSENLLSGSLPASLGQLTELISLDLYSNYLEGVLSEEYFANFTRLKYLDLSYNLLALRLSSGWIPPFQLDTINLDSCQLGPQFPAWLRTQANVSNVHLGGAGIRDTMPDWLQNFSPNIEHLALMDNELVGKVPQFPSKIKYLFLTNNSFSGPIPPSIGKRMPELVELDLSMNNINGSIPLSLCSLRRIQFLHIRENNLSGEPLDCWKDSPDLLSLAFSHNNLSGRIPNSVANLPSLESLHLSSNNLYGELPLALKSCKRLVTLDLGHNEFSGNIPTWIGESLLGLKILSLRSNMFNGSIPQLSHLTSLQILDLSNNNLSGTIPPSFGNFNAMKGTSKPGAILVFNGISLIDYMIIFVKGRELEYQSLLELVMIMDLSNNDLSGYIPEELANLHVLQSLNLSGNHLTGEIPSKISIMQNLECLDLSRNNLSGAIPPSFTSLTFLSHLNLSHNGLSGRIPTGGQMQTFIDPSIYIGNCDLCGFPLDTRCTSDGETPSSEGGDEYKGEDDESDAIWLYMSIAPGFVVGFLVVCGVLVLKNNWRVAYFQAVDNLYDMVYVKVTVNIARLKRIAIGEK